MFTIEQIEEAHSKVKSGADFSHYIHDIKKLGVTHYEVFVTDGHTDYYGANDFRVSAPAKYEIVSIGEIPNKKQFTFDLSAHQKGETNYLTFCNDCGKSGIEKWIVSLQKMTCIYYDKAGNEILIETIPE